MVTRVQDLSGHTVYIRLLRRNTPSLPASFDGLVGEGKLVSTPNDVVVGPGSRWLHERDEKKTFATFGCTHSTQKLGRTIQARCTLMLYPSWWMENHRALHESTYAEIAYGNARAGHCLTDMQAGLFLITKKPSMPSAVGDGTGKLRIDLNQLMRFEFLASGRIVRAFRD